jgi:hypothetical protein
MYLRSSGDFDVFVSDFVPTLVSGGERVIVYDGKRGYVSRENFDWMKTAAPDDLGKMRVMRVTLSASDGWVPKTPPLELETFRYSP